MSIDLALIGASDEAYEEELLRNPYVLKPWIRYLDHKHDRPIHERAFIFERAVKDLPGSYKLWRMYLHERMEHVEDLNPATYEKEWEKINYCFERSLVLLHKMPRIWLEYLQFLLKQCKISHSRRVFDRALRALPLTQHSRIWKLYLPFAESAAGETGYRVYKRYIRNHPEQSEHYIELLLDNEYYFEAANTYIHILNDPNFRSLEGKSNYELWMELCDICVHHPSEMTGINVEQIIRSGIAKFSDQRGKLWTSLATYWVTRGELEKVVLFQNSSHLLRLEIPLKKE
ncbi:Pre-mRNA-splicing factor syf1 [Neolecta irregularis DAH-3]|uniref:Pre-mRNA-splicing factor syf1 n=1 Tax=Neolecta irregularis (strain DAH-3) TaxID=1198029 RepID=A0A1U7LLG3_NEOID|nr:Pre-mRNA-splicing factor syf1 [Neolecta irregularis DAH-3]|eukprot:OLL23494.1 Pre-mRNA-splicing factor syf1 [Neolecta irregularis DAH-3]